MSEGQGEDTQSEEKRNLTVQEGEPSQKWNGKHREKDPRVVFTNDQSEFRTEYLRWKDYFMTITLLTQRMCKVQENKKDAACIFNDENKLVGIGYTSLVKSLFERHPVFDAVLDRNIAEFKNCTIYLYMFPCNECAKVIIQAGIKKVFYYTREEKDKAVSSQETEDQKSKEAAKKMLDDAGVIYRPFNTKLMEFTIDFEGQDPESKTGTERPKTAHTSPTEEETEKSTKVTSEKHSQKEMEENDYFMAIAFLASRRSKDPVTQVGACIVNEKKVIVGIGYNGMPLGFDDAYANWGKKPNDVLESKTLYVCHAELNAVLFRYVADIKNSSLYVTLFPCKECAKVVIQAGIKNVYYYSNKYHDKQDTKESLDLLNNANVILKQFNPTEKKLRIDLDPNRLIWD